MNDLNDDLIEMFRRREGDVRSPASSPTQLVSRTRRREWLSAAIGVAVAVIVVVVSIAGLRSLGSSDGSQPGDVGPTTKTVSGITITYPEGWFAEDPVAIGIEPASGGKRTLPTLVLTLTKDDPHVQGVLGCPRLANIPDQVLMTIQETPLALSGDAATPWPVSLKSADLGSDEVGGCYEGWTFMRAAWTAAGRSFEARVGFASDASDADRTAMTDAYASMTFAPGSVSSQDEAQVATGVTDSGATWSLTAAMTGDRCWDIQIEADNTGMGTGACDGGNGADAPDLIPVHLDPSTTVIAGVVPIDTWRVEVESPDGITEASLYPGPSGRWDGVRFIVFSVPGSSAHGSVTMRFKDPAGHELYADQQITWGQPSEQSQPPNGEPPRSELSWTNEGGTLTANGRFAGTDWKAEVLFYRDGVRLTIDGSAEDLGVLQLDDPIVRPMDTDGFDALFLVLTHTSVDRVSVTSEGTWDGRWMPASTGDGAEARLWVIEVPGAGQGALLLDGQPWGDVRWP